MRRVWLIRAGEGAEEIDPMRHAGLIGLRYDAVGDVRAITPAEIESAIADDGRVAGAAQHRAILQWFANDARPGDLVVSPNPERREVWLGIIAGEYQFSPQPRVEGYGHTRAVDWLGWLDLDAAWMRDQLKAINHPVTMVELYSRDWWWKHAESTQLMPAPRVKWSRTASASRPSSGRSRPTTPRAAPKPAAKPRPKVAAPVLCAGSCGLVWSPYVLVDGLCADCRND